MAFDIRDDDEEHHPDEFEEYDDQDVKQTAPPKFYRRRKFWIFCIPNLIISTIVAVILGLYVIMPKIAQDLMNKAVINFEQIVRRKGGVSVGADRGTISLLFCDVFACSKNNKNCFRFSFSHSRTSPTHLLHRWTLLWLVK